MSLNLPVLEAKRLTKNFGRLKAVDSLDLEVYPGEVVGFLGPNGAGKSTTIRMLLGLSVPTAGIIRVFGRDPRCTPDVRRRIGYSPGELRLDERFTVARIFDLWSSLRGGVDLKYRSELVERLGVELSKRIGSLSTGNRRKVALVGALMGKPEFLILDEPTNGLDPLVQQEFMALLGEASKEGASILLSSHILSEVERLADRVVVIRKGRVIASGRTDELRGNATQELHLRFLDSVPSLDHLLSVPGVFQVKIQDEGTVKIVWSGSPSPLLKELAHFDLLSITAPEPDLETAFLSYYRNDAKVDSP